jgi:chemotaxis protein MotB
MTKKAQRDLEGGQGTPAEPVPAPAATPAPAPGAAAPSGKPGASTAGANVQVPAHEVREKLNLFDENGKAKVGNSL